MALRNKELEEEVEARWEKAKKENANKEPPGKKIQRAAEEYKGNKDDDVEIQLPQLKRFDVTQMKMDLFWLIVGKRRYGKSTYAYNQIAKFFYMFPNGGYCFT
jgi:hypothetical protein